LLTVGKSGDGRETLPNLAGEVAEMDYRNLPLQTQHSYINDLEEYRREKAAAKMVSKKNISKHFGKMMAKLQPEVRAFT